MEMKRRTKEILTAIFLGGLVPAICFRLAEKRVLQSQPAQNEPTVQETTQEITKSNLDQQQIPVLLADGTVQIMELDTYITGVVLAEMPADFEIEALKAQAVVARTYALKRVITGQKHAQQAVCTDSVCCQAFYADAEHYESEEFLEKVRTAVKETENQVLTYDGNLIEATYFSCSGGRTEDALAVWGEEIPYLQSVESPGEEQAAHYVDTVSFSSKDFCQKMGRELSGAPAGWIGEVTYTEGGGVETIYIGGEQYEGTQVRQLLGLRSTAFIITAAGDTIIVTTKGFGHRVGMSQYGADAMAAGGSSYAQILAHYYPGTELQQWQNN